MQRSRGSEGQQVQRINRCRGVKGCRGSRVQRVKDCRGSRGVNGEKVRGYRAS